MSSAQPTVSAGVAGGSVLQEFITWTPAPGPETIEERDSFQATSPKQEEWILTQAVLQYLVPRLLFETERTLHAGSPVPGARLSGELAIPDGKEEARYTVSPAPDGPAIVVQGNRAWFRLGVIETSTPDQPQLRLEGEFTGKRAAATIPIHKLAQISPLSQPAVLEIEPFKEQWTLRRGDPHHDPVIARFTTAQPVPEEFPSISPGGIPGPSISPGGIPGPSISREEIIRNLSRYGLHRPIRFTIPSETDPNIGGYRYTNEISTAFQPFSIRGGAYLGVGSSQNYDHLTTARPEVVFLTDVSSAVVNDHKGMLALIGVSRSPAHFLSRLTGTPLSPEEEALPLPELIALLRKRSSDPDFTKRTLEELRALLPEEEVQAASKVMTQGRNLFLSYWASQITTEKQHRWLWEPERFAHLKFLKNAGRIFISLADVAGKSTLPRIAEELKEWNESHYPPITVNVIYLSNAEEWISRGSSGKGIGYGGLPKNLLLLPLNPDGVILRTGSSGNFQEMEVRKGSWEYMTLPMGAYTMAVSEQKSISYASINQWLGKGLLARRRREEQDALIRTVLREIEGVGFTVSGPSDKLEEAMEKKGLAITSSNGIVHRPTSLQWLRNFRGIETGDESGLSDPQKTMVRTFPLLCALGCRFRRTDSDAECSHPADLLEGWGNKKGIQLLLPGTTTPTAIPSPESFEEFGLAELGEWDQLPHGTRQILESVRSLRDRGFRMGTEAPQDQIVIAPKWDLDRKALRITSPEGRHVVVQRIEDLLAIAGLESGSPRLVDEARFKNQVETLSEMGWRFHASDGEITGHPGFVRHTLRQGNLHVSHGDNSLRLPIRGEMAWESFSAAAAGQSPANSDHASLVEQHKKLVGRGVTTTVGGPAALESAAQFLLAFPKVTFHLPHRIRWGLRYTRRIIPSSMGDLALIAKRLS